MPTRDRITSPAGILFRDLNGNGIMEPYENPTLPPDERVADLLTRMTLEEKAGLMMVSILEAGENGDIVEGEGLFRDATSTLIHDKRMNHFNALRLPGPRYAARWSNRLQDMAANTRLGIPVTLYTDPRHSFSENLGAALAAGAFSQWPEALGLGAIGDPELVARFADIARQEYLAVGIRGALQALAVHREDFLSPRTLRITGQASRDGRKKLPLKHRKAGEYRDVPVPAWLWVKVRDIPEGPLFAGKDDRAYKSYETVRKAFKSAAKREGIPQGFRPHSLRHAFASTLLSRGVPITDVARWLGHKDINETYLTYSHFMPEAEDRAVSTLDAEYAEWSKAA